MSSKKDFQFRRIGNRDVLQKSDDGFTAKGEVPQFCDKELDISPIVVPGYLQFPQVRLLQRLQ